MKRRDLLPGIADADIPPDVVFESRLVILTARRRAAIHDALQLLLLASVDWLFIRWPDAHVPLLARSGSLLLLALVNAASIAAVWSARSLPRWRARRVASTWCPAERHRLINYLIR